MCIVDGMSEPVSFSKNSPRFSVEEQARIRERFAPIAQQYRSGSRRALVIFAVSAVIIASGFLMPRPLAGWVVGAFFICWLTLLVLALTRPPLECPSCRRLLDSRELGSFCPECGSGGLKEGGWFRAPHCDACGKGLRRGKGRLYRIRACTHCGVILDEKGL
jgi:RNA polymerase subunit RPABC4/transcription elongation factor Spt4